MTALFKLAFGHWKTQMKPFKVHLSLQVWDTSNGTCLLTLDAGGAAENGRQNGGLIRENPGRKRYGAMKLASNVAFLGNLPSGKLT